MYDALRTIHVMCFFSLKSDSSPPAIIQSSCGICFERHEQSLCEIVLGIGEFSNNYYEKLPFMCNSPNSG